MVDLFAWTADTKPLKNFDFILWCWGPAEMKVRAGIDEKGLCRLLPQDESKTRICSGSFGEKHAVFTRRGHRTPTVLQFTSWRRRKSVNASKTFNLATFYTQCKKFWETHADGDVKVEQTNNLPLTTASER
jgi:hypothetical protein